MPKGVYFRLGALDRFERMVARPNGPDACHLWLGGISSTGYGNFWLNGKTMGAHVFAYEQAHGPVPEGMILRHTCRPRHCVRLDHLVAGTHLQNNVDDRIRDGVSRGKPTILSLDQITEATRLHKLGVPWTKIATRYSVHRDTIPAWIRRHSIEPAHHQG